MSASDTRMAAASPCAARSTACPASGTAQPAEDGLVVAGLPVLVSDQVDAATLFPFTMTPGSSTGAAVHTSL
jgi:hypothetical protein